jgi:hypothetical protein
VGRPKILSRGGSGPLCYPMRNARLGPRPPHSPQLFEGKRKISQKSDGLQMIRCGYMIIMTDADQALFATSYFAKALDLNWCST